MSIAKYTPGPWVVRTDFKCGNGQTTIGVAARDLGAGSGAVAWPCGTTDEQLIANARLMAAAPELLEANKKARACLLNCAVFMESHGHPDTANVVREYVDMLRAAIVKATGSAA